MREPIREYRNAAGQRFAAAELLLSHKMNLDAMYLGGYTIECSLKALILAKTPEIDRAKTYATISHGKAMHDPLVLARILKSLDFPIPLSLAAKFRRYSWSTDLRYGSGRGDYGEARGFLRTARAVYDWMEGELP